MSDIYTQYGGNLYVPRIAASQPVYGSDPTSQVWGFGWIPLDDRTQEEARLADEAIREMPRFEISGRKSDDPKKAVLWDCSKKINNGQHFRTFYQKTGSCFPAGTPIRMADGSEKAIENVSIGDMVVSHTGEFRPVVETMRRNYTGDMIKVHVAGFAFPLTMTADHQVAVMRGNADWRWQPDRLEWVRADELEEGDRVILGHARKDSSEKVIDVLEILGDCAVDLNALMENGVAPVRVNAAQSQCLKSGVDWQGKVKLVKARYTNAINRFVPVCPSLARLIGLYLAEGGCDSGKVVFTFAGDEESLCGETLALVRGLFGVEGETFISNSRGTSRKVVFTNTTLEAFIKHLVPGNVYTKRVPGVFMHASEDIRMALLDGWLDGDGYAAKHDAHRPSARIQGVTASPGLARDMTTLALSCGLRASCSRRKARGQSREAFDVFLTGKKALAMQPQLAATMATIPSYRPTDTDTNRCEYGYCRKVKRVDRQPVECLPVFDFEVETDHSFIAAGLVVHNCVGNGGGQATWYLSAAEVVRLRDPEQVILPFYLLPYGRSRFHAGMRGRGDGSFGSAFAKAIRTEGILPANTEGLPKWTDQGGITWGSSVEYEWSDGAAIPSKWMEQSKKHLVKTTALLRSADDAREALRNYYPCTIASDWGGQMRPTQQGEPAVLLNRRTTTWMHQMSLQGWWDHPTLGEIFYILNSWGVDAHGQPPDDAPPGGFWVKKSEMESIIRQGDSFAFSQFDGFPAQDLSWYI